MGVLFCSKAFRPPPGDKILILIKHFLQSSRASTREKEGTRLNICRQIIIPMVGSHHISLNEQIKPGAGDRFHSLFKLITEKKAGGFLFLMSLGKDLELFCNLKRSYSHAAKQIFYRSLSLNSVHYFVKAVLKTVSKSSSN